MGDNTHEMKREQEIEYSRGGGVGQALLAFLGGALAGAAVALVVAPTSGRETRAVLKKAYKTSAEKVGRIPTAFKSATSAARASLVEPVEHEEHEEAVEVHH